MNHTPAPWAFSINHSGDYQLRGSNGHLVFQVSTGTIPGNSDARLIASAPELLAALELVFSNAGESPEWIRARIAPVISKANGGAA